MPAARALALAARTWTAAGASASAAGASTTTGASTASAHASASSCHVILSKRGVRVGSVVACHLAALVFYSYLCPCLQLPRLYLSLFLPFTTTRRSMPSKATAMRASKAASTALSVRKFQSTTSVAATGTTCRTGMGCHASRPTSLYLFQRAWHHLLNFLSISLTSFRSSSSFSMRLANS